MTFFNKLPLLKNLIYTAFLIINIHFISLSQSENEIVAQGENSTIDENLLDSLKSIMDEHSRVCYKIELSFSGYESQSEEYWYYNSLGVICGYHLTWNMEGQSGVAFHWYVKGKLLAMYEETEGNSGDPEIIFLKKPEDSEKLKSNDSGTKSLEQKIFKLINENTDKKTENESNISVTIEETVNYGADFIQNTYVYIDKPLYDILFQGK